MVTARIIHLDDGSKVLDTAYPYAIILDEISRSLKMNIATKFDEFLSIMKNHGDLFSEELAEQMKRDLLKTNAGSYIM